MRPAGIAYALVAGLLLVFMVVFIVQHTGLLGRDADGRHPRRERLFPHTARPIALSGVAVLGAHAAHAAAGGSPPLPTLALPQQGHVLFAASFPRRAQLVTNDYAYFNPGNRGAIRSADWLVTSGSLFARDGDGWTGRPDSVRPNADSTNGTGSATFRAVTRRRDFGNVAVAFDLLTLRYASTPANPVHNWDGVHLFLHYRSQRSLYVLTLNRRDDRVLVKKKRPGGPANGGTYYTLGQPVSYTPRLGRWQHVLATIRASANGTVTISAYINGRLLLSRSDNGSGGGVLSQPGAVGLRGDNAEFEFAHFRVSELA
jgi:hypothetical protein